MTEPKVVLDISNAAGVSKIRVELTPTPSKKPKARVLLTPQDLDVSPQVLFGSNGEDSGGKSVLLVAEENVGTNTLFDNNSLSSEGTTTATDAPPLQQTNNSPPSSPLTTTDDNITIADDTIEEDSIKEGTSSSTETEEETTLPSEEDVKGSWASSFMMFGASIISSLSYIVCFMWNVVVKDYVWPLLTTCIWLLSIPLKLAVTFGIKLGSIGKAHAPWLLSGAKDLVVSAWLLFDDTITAYIGGNRQHEDLDEEKPSLIKKLGRICLTIGKLLMFVTLVIGFIYTLSTACDEYKYY